MLLDEAVSSGIVPEAVFVTTEERRNLEARNWDVPGFEIERETMDSVSVLEAPPGVVAVVGLPFVHTDAAEARLVLVLVDISDPGNAGTLIRSAEAAGFDAVLVSGKSVDLSAPKVIRAAAGSAFRMTCGRLESLDDLRRRGATVLGLTSSVTGGDGERSAGGRAVESLYDVPLDLPLAVVVGSEAHGLPPDLPVDRWVTIPHHGPTESLNAAMAGTVACMHVAERLSANGKRRIDARE